MKQIDLRRFKGDLRVATAEEYVILILEDDDKEVEPMGSLKILSSVRIV